ncbi:hypothetical protein [Baaleninema sp.]|uniref:hypothetical protein n=1 Tax=Baaleninema sp. TaxID=3101197 RepID=UPI003D065459
MTYKYRFLQKTALIILLPPLASNFFGCIRSPLRTVNQEGVYEYRSLHSSDGIGKFYIGREIAKVMEHSEMLWLERLDRQRQERPDLAMNSVENLQPVLGTATHPNLPVSSLVLGLRVDAHHEFEWPREMMERAVQSLKPDGRVVWVEYRGENPLIPLTGLHKMTKKQVKQEMAAVGLPWRSTDNGLPNQDLMVFFRANALANLNFVKE